MFTSECPLNDRQQKSRIAMPEQILNDFFVILLLLVLQTITCSNSCNAVIHLVTFQIQMNFQNLKTKPTCEELGGFILRKHIYAPKFASMRA
jgi:hypothetical protein